MSTEQININELRPNENKQNQKSSKVDINILLNRIRAEKKKAKKENIVLFSIVSSVIVATGVIASL